jgi:hypothetical protein
LCFIFRLYCFAKKKNREADRFSGRDEVEDEQILLVESSVQSCGPLLFLEIFSRNFLSSLPLSEADSFSFFLGASEDFCASVSPFFSTVIYHRFESILPSALCNGLQRKDFFSFFLCAARLLVADMERERVSGSAFLCK